MTARLALILLSGLLALSACNTVSGIGKDIEKAGEAIQGAGEKGRK
ncbi:entericidin A/B family lipoprotein [Aerophototrophica crusticola]|uniref:Entericidin A/B family lipoprotein n=1 Tax=Aerophototrophica crusticola TaxID=1709002 RepID=A0A858R7C8_9PROT|nr:entericidin A/B family lipoprotein [Rhodospirillaceae bacterium B3]